MQTAAWLMFTSLLGVSPSNAHSVDSTFHNLVCRQCNSWCSVDQVVQIEPRIGKSGPRGPRGEKGVPGRPAVVNMSAIEELVEMKINEALIIHIGYKSCRGVNLARAKSRNESGGVFDIAMPGGGTKEVYCNTQGDGGGWIVFQRRMDGSVDFYRNWNEYVAGFGTATGEYWLGLEAIYQLTKYGGIEMRVDMIAQDGTYYYAKYSNFRIDPASHNYRLTVRGYSGNASDSLDIHNNQQFSTKDRDNDRHSSHCASNYKGGWWYNSCFHGNMNGVYGLPYTKGITWKYPNRGRVQMSFTEMKFRKEM